MSALANDGIVDAALLHHPLDQAGEAGWQRAAGRSSLRRVGPWHPAQFWAKMLAPVPGAYVEDGSGSGVAAGVNGPEPAGEADAGEALRRRTVRRATASVEDERATQRARDEPRRGEAICLGTPAAGTSGRLTPPDSPFVVGRRPCRPVNVPCMYASMSTATA